MAASKSLEHLNSAEAATMEPTPAIEQIATPQQATIVPGKPSRPLSITDPEPSASEGAIAEDESHYPTGAQFLLIMVAVGSVLILASIGTDILGVAVPAITDTFHTTTDVGWYSAAYRLCMCAFQFMFGKLYRLVSTKRVFLISTLIFALGSVLCAAAQSSSVFILGRAVAGLGTAGVLAGCYAILVDTLPLRKRPLWQGLMAAVEGLSNIFSPILGGILVQKASWRWCFWMVVPLAGLNLVMLWFCLADDTRRPGDEEPTTWRQKLIELDLLGTAIFLPALTCFFFALGYAGTRYPWNSPAVIALFCTFAVLLAAFAYEQYRRGDSATLPPRVMRSPAVLSGFTFAVSCNAAMWVVQYYLPTYFQAVRGRTPTESGVLMLPILVGFLSAMVLQGIGVSLVGHYVPFMLAGSILMPVFAGLMTTITPETDLSRILVYSGLLGFAGGIGFQAPQTAVQASLSPKDSNLGLAVILFAQGFGPAVFLSAAQTIFVNRLSDNLQDLVPGLNASTIETMGLTDLRGAIGDAKLSNVLIGLDRSLTQTWYLAVALTCLTMVGSVTMKWRNVKQKKA
jgi:MFS family permease